MLEENMAIGGMIHDDPGMTRMRVLGRGKLKQGAEQGSLIGMLAV